MTRAVTPRFIIRMLLRQGFVLKRIRGSHHIFQHPVTKRRAVVPLHRKDLPKGTLHEILKQAELSEQDL